ncbi:2,5-didehydrogluconate reductase DkgB [Aliiglaciecola sp. LCG003]|uniref:2,5-didehydrogluconate reductase DkgB n=1 Tax=Aliiglaciecola sp. LCG003 TaxID=3053655 RepID=UPI00257386F2|nr:2,5-didehydrogluconate reductase DkgB [Aliiglaciecola sp. LCG003]WJG09843.1 2,5-didehydrogluconate reductase DkgB [Aliiglaciecola sp. LCG003]
MYNVSIPSPGFGTFRFKGTSLQQAIQHALEAGFRHIDTAQVYGNEKDVGQAIADSDVSRSDIFLTTKVWTDNFSKDKFLPSVEQSLEDLQTDYVDLLLIHWPSPEGKVPMEEYLSELVSAMHKGYTRAIGVSNFTAPLLEQAFAVIGQENVTCNQIEIHPQFQNSDMVNFCRSKGIEVVGYMPLGNGNVMQDKILQKIAKEHDVSPASIAIAWQIQHGIIPIPASTSKEHIHSNFEAKGIRLTAEQMDKITKLDTNKRLIDPDFAPHW